MPQTKADKLFFDFTGGINTEVSPLNFPDGVSLDEENFDLLPDGTRRRRKGLRQEAFGVNIDISTLDLDSDSAFAYHRWANVAGDSELRYIVVQVGQQLLFFLDDETLSPQKLSDEVDLTAFRTTDDAISDVKNFSVSFTDGLGMLFVVGPHIEPVLIQWDRDLEAITTTAISLRVRDFVGIDDGVPVNHQPTTLSDNHYYNLRNRGWEDEFVDQYFTDTGAYPAKNQVPWFGYRRATEVGYAEQDGTQEWNSTKLENEVFGVSSAPQGALYIYPFDTSNSAGISPIGEVAITDWDITGSFTPPGGGGEPPGDPIWTILITTASAHGLVVSDEVQITGNQYQFMRTNGTTGFGTLNGTTTVDDVPSATTLEVQIEGPFAFSSFVNQYLKLGFVGEDTLTNPDGIITTNRPRAVAWYGSRVFYAGVNDAEYNDVIFFSQIVQKENQVGRCYQENDPTAENLNELLPTDGGTIQVPGLGGVLKMVPFGSSLYVFGTQGVWEIGPGREGFFSAMGYSVRKVSDIECSSSLGIVTGDFGVVFTSPRGIYTLTQDPNSGFVVPQSLSDQRIQTIWNSIPTSKQNKVQCAFDSAIKRYYILYSDDLTTGDFFYNKTLVFDPLHGAWYKQKFPGVTADHIMGFMTIEAADVSDENKKLKFVVAIDSFEDIQICDMDHTDFEDFDGTEQIPFLLTGYDNVGDFQRRRQAPVAHVFMRRTETGVTEDGDTLVPINESSVFLEARWDWADRDITGKFSNPQQVYRHVRLYQPLDSSDTFDTGYPVVVTRNKVRGRGRSLHLKFYGETGKDAHLIGWALQYAGTRRV